MSEQRKQPPFNNAMFIDGSKFCKQYLKRVTQGTFQNLTNGYREDENFFKSVL